MEFRVVRRVLRPLKTVLAGQLLTLVRWAESCERDDARNQLFREFASCGKDVQLYAPFTVHGRESITIGDNVHIASNCYIQGSGGLSIGSNTHISRNVVLYTTNHNYNGNCLPYDSETLQKPVSIGRNVWIGMNVCIAPGTTIGDGAIVAMGTTVSGEVPPYTIVGSERWRILGMRDSKHYARLEELERYGGVNGRELQTPQQR